MSKNNISDELIIETSAKLYNKVGLDKLSLKMIAEELEKAKTVPCRFNNWANFYKGEFVSNTILNANSFKKLL